VHVSSAAVYGSAVHAKEQARLNPLRGFLYAQHQAYLEHLLAIEVPECVRLRPHVILGPHVHPMIKRFLNQPFCLRLNEPQPLFQCIDGDDLAQAVILSLESDARGAYNLAAEESFTLREALGGRAWLTAGLPSSVVASAFRVAGRVLRWGADPGIVQAMSHPLLINCRRAIAELGWRCHYTAKAALART
jgi:nucleoside-diphosphate-sugar epimerase